MSIQIAARHLQRASTSSARRSVGLQRCLAAAVLLGLASAVSAAPDRSIERATTLKAQWQAYLHQQMAPDFDWLDLQPAALPSVLSPLRETLAARLQGERHVWFQLGDQNTSIHLRFAPVEQQRHQPTDSTLGLLGGARSMLQGEFVSSSFERTVGEDSHIALGAVLARQRFASAGFGLHAWEGSMNPYGLHVSSLPETATGGGVRLDYDAGIGSTMSLRVGVQSRIEMDSFKSYRGVYSEPGDFDIPARIEAELGFQPQRDWHVAVGVEQIYYSDVDAFTSAALPRRLLSLLGDGAAPIFAWRDLTVYSAETALDDRYGGRWSVRYTTQQQPEPTSALLLRAMQAEYTDTNWALGYQRGLGNFGNLSLAASYAPSRYFLGATPYVQRDLDRGAQVEVEAIWRLTF